MKLIEKTFLRYVLIESSLISYGFVKTDDSYSYVKSIHNGEFELQLNIKSNKIDGKLIDKAFDDEYLQINVENATGTFLNELKEECLNVLIDIRNKCFVKQYFIYPQSNRVAEYAIKKYDATPEFLFDDSPDCGVFRNKKSQKWFGIIMHIKKEKIIKETDGKVEVMNLKLDDRVEDLLKTNGIYRAYHMNKKNWISIILDDTISDDDLFDLIDYSYNASCK